MATTWCSPQSVPFQGVVSSGGGESAGIGAEEGMQVREFGVWVLMAGSVTR